MAICPIISTKDNLSDCIRDKCAFFDGCMILDAYNNADAHSEAIDELEGDIIRCQNDVDSVRYDFDGFINSITED